MATKGKNLSPHEEEDDEEELNLDQKGGVQYFFKSNYNLFSHIKIMTSITMNNPKGRQQK